MHILLIHQAFTALHEPGGTRHHELARYLAGMGHQITVIASPVSYLTGTAREGHIAWVDRQSDGKDITILRAYTYPALHRSFFHRLLSFVSFMISSFMIGLQVKNIDLVWGTSPPIFQGGTAWAIARLKHVPFAFEVRDLWPAFAIAVGVLKHPLLIRLSEWLEKFLYLSARLVIVNSPGFIPHITARGAKRVELVPNGADLDMFHCPEEGDDFRKKHHLQEKFLTLYAGAHGLSNDLGVLLETANLLQDRPDIAIILLGDGKEKPALQERARQMGLTNLYFLPPVPKMEMPLVLAACQACIAILKPIEMYKTVYPNKVFDYMAAGKPVILAIDGVIRQVVEEAQAGIPVKPGDPAAVAEAIQSLADDPLHAEELGKNGREYIKTHFNRLDMAKKLADLFEEISLRSG